jgi:hypothetical protein
MMQATLVLCDFAEIDSTGKVHILGAGWSVTGPAPAPQGIVAFLKVPAERAQSPIQATLRLLDQERHLVEVPGIGGTQVLEISGQIEMQMPETWDHALDLSASFAVNVGPLPLTRGMTYSWTIEIDGKELASVDFLVRPS